MTGISPDWCYSPPVGLHRGIISIFQSLMGPTEISKGIFVFPPLDECKAVMTYSQVYLLRIPLGKPRIEILTEKIYNLSGSNAGIPLLYISYLRYIIPMALFVLWI
jgi:hypothetical protein